MEVLNYTTLRKNLKKTLDNVVQNDETVIVNRSNGNVVLLSLDDYNSLQETLHLLSTEENRNRLKEAIERDKTQQYEIHDLIEDEV